MLTVITPTIPGRENLLAECKESVSALGLPHLVQVDQNGEGPAVIRNRLVEQVTTDWMLCLDDDDLLMRNYLRIVRPHLAAADVVYTDWHLTGAPEPYPLGGFDGDLLLRENFIPVTACVRVDAFRAVGGFPTDAPFEDHELWKAMYVAGYRFRHVPAVAWWYRRRRGSRLEAVG